MKFPVVLRDKLLNGEIELPDSALIEYESVLTYRAVERKAEDHREITRTYFLSSTISTFYTSLKNCSEIDKSRCTGYF